MSDRIRTVDMSDPSVVLDCYKKLNVAYKELKAENEKLRAELSLYTGPAAQVDRFPTHTRIRIDNAAIRETGNDKLKQP